MAIRVALNPNALNASFCFLVADAPEVNRKTRFLIPVAAISSPTPTLTIVAPRAAISLAVAPPISPKGPILVTMSEIFGAEAAVVLPR